MITSAIIFGGSGYIGSHILKYLQEQNAFEKYLVYDIVEPRFCLESHKKTEVKFSTTDIRKPIAKLSEDIDPVNSWIFNLAAIHREPGHEFREYFDTNIPGAENVCEFARTTGIKNIFFTSSIAPYGRSMEERSEESPLYPETAYGISKALAEQIHQKWLHEEGDRRLIIARPSVIFGPKDPGNIYRMIKALKKGTFILPDGGKVIKAYGYVLGLVESIVFAINLEKRLIVYNYAENPLVQLREMVNIAKKELGYTKPTLKLSTRLLAILAFFLQKGYRLLGKQSDIHPVRVRKAGFPTNIRPKYLIDNGFEFKYDFKNALKHWRSATPEDFK